MTVHQVKSSLRGSVKGNLLTSIKLEIALCIHGSRILLVHSVHTSLSQISDLTKQFSSLGNILYVILQRQTFEGYAAKEKKKKLECILSFHSKIYISACITYGAIFIKGLILLYSIQSGTYVGSSCKNTKLRSLFFNHY